VVAQEPSFELFSRQLTCPWVYGNAYAVDNRAIQAKRDQVGPIHFGVQVGFINFQWCLDVVIML